MISTQISQYSQPKLEVVSCYVEHNRKFLLLQRHKEHECSLQWGLPAGKKDGKETNEQAIIREIKEETGLTLKEQQLSYREVLFVSHLGREFLYHVFHVSLSKKPLIRINPPEHKQFGWFSAQQALGKNLIPDLDTCIKRHYELVEVRS